MPFSDNENKLDNRKKEFLCPFCRRLSNYLIPIFTDVQPLKKSTDELLTIHYPSHFSSSGLTKQNKAECTNLFQDILARLNIPFESLISSEVDLKSYLDQVDLRYLVDFKMKIILRELGSYLQIYHGTHNRLASGIKIPNKSLIGNFQKNIDDWIFYNKKDDFNSLIKIDSLLTAYTRFFILLVV